MHQAWQTCTWRTDSGGRGGGRWKGGWGERWRVYGLEGRQVSSQGDGFVCACVRVWLACVRNLRGRGHPDPTTECLPPTPESPPTHAPTPFLCPPPPTHTHLTPSPPPKTHTRVRILMYAVRARIAHIACICCRLSPPTHTPPSPPPHTLPTSPFPPPPPHTLPPSPPPPTHTLPPPTGT